MNLASDAGLQANRGAAVYCASKGGVVLFSKTLALDLAADGIRVNAVCPGDVMTPMLQGQADATADPEAYLARLLAGYAQGSQSRFIRPDEVAELIWFLAQPAAARSPAPRCRSTSASQPASSDPNPTHRILCCCMRMLCAHGSREWGCAARRRPHRLCHSHRRRRRHRPSVTVDVVDVDGVAAVRVVVRRRCGRRRRRGGRRTAVIVVVLGRGCRRFAAGASRPRSDEPDEPEPDEPEPEEPEPEEPEPDPDEPDPDEPEPEPEPDEPEPEFDRSEPEPGCRRSCWTVARRGRGRRPRRWRRPRRSWRVRSPTAGSRRASAWLSRVSRSVSSALRRRPRTARALARSEDSTGRPIERATVRAGAGSTPSFTAAATAVAPESTTIPPRPVATVRRIHRRDRAAVMGQAGAGASRRPWLAVAGARRRSVRHRRWDRWRARGWRTVRRRRGSSVHLLEEDS